jgi:2-oxoisovalerate dehydrogenase E1 component
MERDWPRTISFVDGYSARRHRAVRLHPRRAARRHRPRRLSRALRAWLARVEAHPAFVPQSYLHSARRFHRNRHGRPVPPFPPATERQSRVVCDENFMEFVRAWTGTPRRRPAASEPVLPGSACSARDFLALFESQLMSRHLDLMARVLRVQQKVFYTIGSSGHEGNAMVARLTRHTDPAFLHYRSGGFMAERFRKLPGMDPIMDSALSFAAARDDRSPAGGTRSGAASRCGCCRRPRRSPRTCPRRWHRVAIEQAGASATAADPGRLDRDLLVRRRLEQPRHRADRVQRRAWTAYQKLPAPVLYVCEDNGIGISVKTPDGWIASNFRDRRAWTYFYADGLDLATGYGQVQRAVEHCRRTRRPTFLHLRTTRIMGHAGTDFEIEWRSVEELMAVEAGDPLLRSAQIALESGLMTKDDLLALYEAIRASASPRPRTPTAPEARRSPTSSRRWRRTRRTRCRRGRRA